MAHGCILQDRGKKTLVLDLDETLVHSSFKPISDPDHIIPVEIEGKVVDVYVLKRPLMDEFLAAVGHSFEVVVFTASLSKYADPLLDLLDPQQVVRSATYLIILEFSPSQDRVLSCWETQELALKRDV